MKWDFKFFVVDWNKYIYLFNEHYWLIDWLIVWHPTLSLYAHCLLCHTCCNMGLWFFWSHLKVSPIYLITFDPKKGTMKTYYTLDSHGTWQNEYLKIESWIVIIDTTNNARVQVVAFLQVNIKQKYFKTLKIFISKT